MREKDLHHFKNLHGAQGVMGLDGKYWRGTYYRRGIGQVSKEKRPQVVVNPIFNMKGEIIFHDGKINL